jgi:hypothetical protein
MAESKIEERISDMESRLSILEIKAKIKKNNDQVIKKSIHPAANREVSGNLLGWISSICFILAAGLIIKLSFDSGWLTHEKQLGIATLFGFALFAGGLFISNSDNYYARFLPAAGSAILYLTCFAAYQFYYLILFQTVIAISCLITALTIWFYVQFKHDIYAILAVIGAYSAPILTNVDHNAIFSLYYFIICSLTFTTLSIWVQSRTLTVISSYLAIASTGYAGINLDINGLIVFTLSLHFLIFSIGSYLYSQCNQQTLSYKECWSFLPVLLIFYTLEYFYIDKLDPFYAPVVSIAAAVLLILLYRAADKRPEDLSMPSSGLIVTFSTLVFFHSVYLKLLPTDFKPWLFVCIVVTYGLYRKQLLQRSFRYTNLFPIIAVSSILSIEYLNIISHLLFPINLNWTLIAWCSYASLIFAILKNQHYLKQSKNYIHVALASAQLLAVLGLYQLALPWGTLAISLGWLAYALIILTISRLKYDLDLAKSTFIILIFSALKALIYDAASTASPARILSLLFTGIILYTSGFTIRKMTRNTYAIN